MSSGNIELQGSSGPQRNPKGRRGQGSGDARDVSPDGSALLVTSPDGGLSLWNVEGQEARSVVLILRRPLISLGANGMLRSKEYGSSLTQDSDD